MLFEKIASAKIPDKFTHSFLQNTIGLKGTNDRAFIPFLRNLGFLDNSGTPTSAYALLKSKDKSKGAIAEGVRKAFGPLFDADQQADELSGEKLRGLVAQVAGSDDAMTSKIAGTFSAITKLADFKVERPPSDAETKESKATKEEPKTDEGEEQSHRIKGLRTEFHYNIQVHLPSNGTEETYLNIFNAIRKTFQ
jgi:hypothetical protein